VVTPAASAATDTPRAACLRARLILLTRMKK
jgi:hypothetical protein